MKCNISKEGVTIISETRAEAERLVALVLDESPRKVKKHRKHVFKYDCDVCGKSCKGRAGLGIHKASHKDNFYGEPTTREG